MVAKKSADKDPDKFDKVTANYKQIRRKLKKLDDVYIDSANNKQILKDIRDILVDIRQLLKTGHGIHQEDDVD